ncbi:hypothetical protein GTW51_14945 [Aurantimonas aggregata]|uniref:Uncharacterized protein n=1 Tax=Aurantimonas aggregata TaxID=2047720 RepID=A0A6L9MKI8_9HYPH|nr:hypothetical protein [Aurantimonas aggregata]NDV88000.1 hypothetical protein [Aurantimonas aggregata]
MTRLDHQPHGRPAALAPLDPAIRRALQALHRARPLGLARTTGGFRGIADHVDTGTGLVLKDQGLARIDHAGHYPRLKINRAGRSALKKEGSS